MRWLKKDLSKAVITITSMALFIGLMVSIPRAVQFGRAPAAKTGTVQATPAVKATATALAVDVLQQQDAKLQRDNSGIWPVLNAVGGAGIGGIGTICLAIAAFITAWKGFKQWRGDHDLDREKQAEERFQNIVEGFSSEREEAKVGAAIMLRTFLQQGYEPFYQQAFDLAVTHLRLRRTKPEMQVEKLVEKLVQQKQADGDDAPILLTPLSQALIRLFWEAYPSARDWIKKQLVSKDKSSNPFILDASWIQLDNAYLSLADLADALLDHASLQKAFLTMANLTEAQLRWANLRWAQLNGADLSGAALLGADLTEADLSGTNPSNKALLTEATLINAKIGLALKVQLIIEGDKFNLVDSIKGNVSPGEFISAKSDWAKFIKEKSSKTTKFSEPDLDGKLMRATSVRCKLIRTNLRGTNLRGADLRKATLIRTDLRGADLTEAKLNGATLIRVKLKGAKLNGTTIEKALSLKGTRLYPNNGLIEDQIKECTKKDKDAITLIVYSVPTSPVSSKPATIAYDGFRLANASRITMHWGYNNWNSITDTGMTKHPSGAWKATITVPSTATTLNVAFYDQNGDWDNNQNTDYHLKCIAM